MNINDSPQKKYSKTVSKLVHQNEKKKINNKTEIRVNILFISIFQKLQIFLSAKKME